jgi:hypothetical protein
MKEHHGDKC